MTSTSTGLREWLTRLSPPSSDVATAAFDTRIRRPRLPGSAARKAEKQLRRLGFRPISPPTTFWVSGTEGPLLDGEAARAQHWGVRIGAMATRAGAVG